MHTVQHCKTSQHDGIEWQKTGSLKIWDKQKLNKKEEQNPVCINACHIHYPNENKYVFSLLTGFQILRHSSLYL